MSIAVFVPFAFAEYEEPYDYGTEGSLQWEFYSDGLLKISGNGDLPDYDYDSGNTPGWLNNRQNITDLVIQSGVTSIGSNAFYQLYITSCSLPEGLLSIGDRAFAFCGSLREISIPSSVTNIGSNAFCSCTALREIDFMGDAPNLAGDCFSGVSSYVYPSCLKSGWTEASKSMYGGQLIWELHQYSSETTKKDPGCTEDGWEEKTCARCGHTEKTAILAPGHKTEHIKEVEATCTEDGNIEYYHCTVCDKYFSDSAFQTEIKPEDTETFRLGHITVIDPEVPATRDTPGLTEGAHCERCGEIIKPREEIPALGYVVNFPDLPDMTEVDIGGERYYIDPDGNITLSQAPSGFAAAYTFYGLHATAPHLSWPTGMQVYAIVDSGEGLEAQRLTFLDKTAAYGGCSIRCRGKTGIRAEFMIKDEIMTELCMTGIEGYKLLEYGMVGAFGNRDNLSIEDSDATVVPAFLSGAYDNSLSIEASWSIYAAEFIDFPKADWGEDFTIRSYLEFETPWGTDILYGPPVTRSIGFIAAQNRNTYAYGTDEYKYIQNIIRATGGK